MPSKRKIFFSHHVVSIIRLQVDKVEDCLGQFRVNTFDPDYVRGDNHPDLITLYYY